LLPFAWKVNSRDGALSDIYRSHSRWPLLGADRPRAEAITARAGAHVGSTVN